MSLDRQVSGKEVKVNRLEVCDAPQKTEDPVQPRWRCLLESKVLELKRQPEGSPTNSIK